jgi:hypothetical protein
VDELPRPHSGEKIRLTTITVPITTRRDSEMNTRTEKMLRSRSKELNKARKAEETALRKWRDAVRKAYKSGATPTQLAEVCQVTRPTIYAALGEETSG